MAIFSFGVDSMFAPRFLRRCVPQALMLSLCVLCFLKQVEAERSVRIVGGVEAARGAWPFMAAIIAKGSNPSDGQYCGGSLIASRWVVSAAHCFVDQGAVTPANQVQVGLKLHDLRTDPGEIINVSRIIVHPQYDPQSSNNDIALLELSAASTAAPIALNTATGIAGINATVIGWGLTSESGASSPVLRQVTIPIVTNAVCNASYGGITDTMVCAGLAAGGKDTCQGDSGGPLVIPNGNAYVLAGLTSFGEGCARPNLYGVYTRLANYLDFISQNTGTPTTPQVPHEEQELTQFGLWNGYLSMVNILELTNPSSQAITAQINLYSAAGQLVSSNFFSIPANTQQDVVVNNLPGFSADAFGVLHISSNVRGRVAFYRSFQNAFQEFEFAFAVPLSMPVTGKTFIGFNTFDPSSSGKLVANWLSIVNLNSGTASFIVRKYLSNGVLLSQNILSIPAFSRIDVDGGHLNPGPSAVGSLEVEPVIAGGKYLAQLTRYGYGATVNSFDFAFSLVADAGWNSAATIPLGGLYSAQNWLELVNVSSSASSFAVEIYNNAGALLQTITYPLAAKAQVHINTTAVLGSNIQGYARITPLSGAYIAQSMFYFKEISSSNIASMYGSQVSAPDFTQVKGPYNLFLGMENYLRVTNTSSSSQTVTITLTSTSSAGVTISRTVGANKTLLFPLHQYQTYGTVADSYGVVTVTPNNASAGILYELVRVKRYTGDGNVQFAVPTQLGEP